MSRVLVESRQQVPSSLAMRTSRTRSFEPWLLSVLYPATWSIASFRVLELGPVGISSDRLIGLAVACGFFSTFLMGGLRPPKLPRLVLFGLVLLIGAYGASWAISPNPEGLESWLGLAQKSAFAYFVYTFIDSVKRIRTAINAFIICAAVTSLSSIFLMQYFGDPHLFRDGWFYREEIALTGSFLGVLTAAGLAMRFVPMAGWLLLNRFRPGLGLSQAVVVASALGLFAAAAYATVRREMVFGIALGLLFLIGYGRAKMRMPALLVVAIGAATVLGAQVSGNFGLLMNRVSGTAAADEPRVQVLRASWDAFLESPFVGAGPGNYGAVMRKHPEHFGEWFGAVGNLSPHNAIAGIGVEAGVFGLIGFLLLVTGLVGQARAALRVRNASREVELVVRLLPIILVQLAIWIMVGSGIGENVLWYWVGLVLAVSRLAVSQSADAPIAGGAREVRVRRRPLVLDHVS